MKTTHRVSLSEHGETHKYDYLEQHQRSL